MEMGDEHGPLRVEFVKGCCEKLTNETDISHPTHGREAGTVSAGRKIRKFHEGRNMIVDDKTKRPDKALPTLHNIKKICWESMPGLCDADPADLKTVTKKVCCNLNTLCTGWDAMNLAGRCWRFEFVIAQKDVPQPGDHQLQYMYGDAFLGYVRLKLPPVQLFLPMTSNANGTWQFKASFDRDNELQVTTSYAQVVAYVRAIVQKNCVVHSVYLHEFWTAPSMEKEHGLLILKVFAREHLQAKSLTPTIEANPVCIFPDVLTRVIRGKKQQDKPPLIPVTPGMDAVDAAFAREAN